MTDQLRFLCPEPKCKEPLGLSTRFIAKRLVQQKLPGEHASEEEKENFLSEAGVNGLFAEFQISIDPVLGISFPLWCPKCEDIRYVQFSLREIYGLSLMDIERS